MLIVTRKGDRRCKLPPHQRALVGLVPGLLRPEATWVRAVPWVGVSFTCADGPQTSVVVRRCCRAVRHSPGAVLVRRNHQ